MTPGLGRTQTLGAPGREPARREGRGWGPTLGLAGEGEVCVLAQTCVGLCTHVGVCVCVRACVHKVTQLP